MNRPTVGDTFLIGDLKKTKYMVIRPLDGYLCLCAESAPDRTLGKIVSLSWEYGSQHSWDHGVADLGSTPGAKIKRK